MPSASRSPPAPRSTRRLSPRAILLDLNDTPFDGRHLPRAVEDTCADLATRYGLAASTLLEAKRRAWSSRWPAAEYDWTLGHVTSRHLSLEAWRDALGECGCLDPSAPEAAVAPHTANALRSLALFEDVRPFLDAAVGRVALAIVSNGDAVEQRPRLRHF